MFDYFRHVEKTHEKLIVTIHNKPAKKLHLFIQSVFNRFKTIIL